MDEGLDVRFRDCTCPDTPHDGRDGADDGDIVTMRPSLGFAAGAEALRLMMESIVVISATGGGEDGTEPVLDTSRTTELVGPVYVRAGVESWNVVGDKGPLPFDAESILSVYAWSYPIVEKADHLYSEGLVNPLALRMNARSAKRSNSGPTRQTCRSSKPRRSQPKSSSLNGSAGQRSQVSQ